MLPNSPESKRSKIIDLLFILFSLTAQAILVCSNVVCNLAFTESNVCPIYYIHVLVFWISNYSIYVNIL